MLLVIWPGGWVRARQGGTALFQGHLKAVWVDGTKVFDLLKKYQALGEENLVREAIAQMGAGLTTEVLPFIGAG